MIGCPLNIVDSVQLGVPGKIVTWEEPTSNDNSGVSSMTSRTHAPGTFFLVDVTTVTYVFSDESGNTAECSFTVNIVEGKKAQNSRNFEPNLTMKNGLKR